LGYLTSEDAVRLYSLATELDEWEGVYPPEDTGSSGLAVAKAGIQLGFFSTYNHAFGFEHFTSTLQTQPVIVGTYWLSQMFNPDADGRVQVKGTVEGGHEYLALGVDYETETLTFLNSWGPSWGANGRFKISFADFAFLLNQEGDATAPVVPVVAPLPEPEPTPVPEPEPVPEPVPTPEPEPQPVPVPEPPTPARPKTCCEWLKDMFKRR
jgi:hypothetical protein